MVRHTNGLLNSFQVGFESNPNQHPPVLMTGCFVTTQPIRLPLLTFLLSVFLFRCSSLPFRTFSPRAPTLIRYRQRVVPSFHADHMIDGLLTLQHVVIIQVLLHNQGMQRLYMLEHRERRGKLTLTVLVTTIDAHWEGMGDVRLARYEPTLLPPCPTIKV